MNSKSMGSQKMKEVLQLVTCRVSLLWRFWGSECLGDCGVSREAKLRWGRNGAAVWLHCMASVLPGGTSAAGHVPGGKRQATSELNPDVINQGLLLLLWCLSPCRWREV